VVHPGTLNRLACITQLVLVAAGDDATEALLLQPLALELEAADLLVESKAR
jgi:hypothetical protein